MQALCSKSHPRHGEFHQINHILSRHRGIPPATRMSAVVCDIGRPMLARYGRKE